MTDQTSGTKSSSGLSDQSINKFAGEFHNIRALQQLVRFTPFKMTLSLWGGFKGCKNFQKLPCIWDSPSGPPVESESDSSWRCKGILNRCLFKVRKISLSSKKLSSVCKQKNVMLQTEWESSSQVDDNRCYTCRNIEKRCEMVNLQVFSSHPVYVCRSPSDLMSIINGYAPTFDMVGHGNPIMSTKQRFNGQILHHGKDRLRCLKHGKFLLHSGYWPYQLVNILNFGQDRQQYFQVRFHRFCKDIQVKSTSESWPFNWSPAFRQENPALANLSSNWQGVLGHNMKRAKHSKMGTNPVNWHDPWHWSMPMIMYTPHDHTISYFMHLGQPFT